MSDREEILVGEFPFVPKQDRAQQKRNALLKSGQTLFISKGYEQTTAKEIAAHAGVATGTFYRYFLDKRQLLMSLIEDKLDKLLPPEPSWLSRDPEELLASLLEEHHRSLNNWGLQHVLLQLMQKDIELAEVLRSSRKRIYGVILSGLKQASENGLIWKDLDLDTITWSIMLLVEKGTEIEEQTGRPTNYHDLAKVICRMVFPPNVLEKLRTTEISQAD